MSERSFSDLGASAPVVRALSKRGIDVPFPIQSLVAPDAMAGRDVLAKSRTGSGKTLAFAVPIVERVDPAAKCPAAVVLVPTRELASQVAEDFTEIAAARKLRVATAYGGVGLTAQGNRAARSHILIATPGRLQDLCERRMVSLESVGILVLDEADRMLDMGFQPQVDRLVRRMPKDRQTMFFSATLEGAAGNLARAYTRDAVRHEVEAPRQTVDEVEHRFVPVTQEGKVKALADLLSSDEGRAVVFVRTKRGADRLVYRLRAQGVEAAAMHGDMNQRDRERALARFESGKVRTLVATDVAARGLDVDDITHVVNYDPPEDHTGYVHRVGRTARAGKRGTGVTFVTPDQHGDVSRIARMLTLHDEFQAEGMTIAAPRLVYASKRGGRSQLYGRRGRRF